MSKSKRKKRDFVNSKRQARSGGFSDYFDVVDKINGPVTDWDGKVVSQGEIETRATEFAELTATASDGCEIDGTKWASDNVRDCVKAIWRVAALSEKYKEEVECMLAEYGCEGDLWKQGGKAFGAACVDIVGRIKNMHGGKPAVQKRKRSVAEAVGVGSGGSYDGYFQ